jgi:polyketide synthase PksN
MRNTSISDPSVSFAGLLPPEGLEAQFSELLAVQLQAAGLFDEMRFGVREAKARIGLRSLYDRWLDESLRVLSRWGYLDYDGVTCCVKDDALAQVGQAWHRWESSKDRWLADARLKAQVQLVEATLRALPAILTGKQPATDVIFPNGSMRLVEDVYKNNPVADYFNARVGDILAAYMEARLRQDAGAQIRILEIGAGTGGTSALLFERLRPYQAHIEEYCYTDLSRAFLFHAEKSYGAANPYLTYRIFDVSKPLASQGMAAARYDVVVATNVLHATSSIRQSVRNAKATLRTNGLLLLNELSENHLFAHLTFGLLDGWWLYEDVQLRIPGCPGLSPASWQSVLEAEGYRSVFFPAEEAHTLGQQIVVAESDGVIRQSNAVAAPASYVEQPAGPAREPRDQKRTTKAKPKTRSTAADVTDQMVVDYVRGTVLDCVSEVLKFDVARIQETCSFAEYGLDSILAVGLVNLVNERLRLRLQTTVLFDHNNVNQLVKHIVDEHKASLAAHLEGQGSDEAADGQLVDVPAPGRGPSLARARNRLAGRPQDPLRDRPGAQDDAVRPGGQAVGAGMHGTYHRVLIEGPGQVSDLAVSLAPVPALQDHEVRVAVHAFSLNFADLLCVSGLYPTMPPYPFTAGAEISGTVVAVGRDVTAVRAGEEVIALTGPGMGGHATQVTVDAELVFAKPGGVSHEQACALPVVALTMIDAFHKAQLRKGETILIQTAAGGTGLVAVQLAMHYGADIIATAGSQHKLDYLDGLGVPHLINYLEQDFESEVARLTEGRGVDVVINTLPGDAMQKGLNCLAPGGRYIEIAMTALKSARGVDLSVLNSNQSFFSIDLGRLLSNKRDLLRDYMAQLRQLVEQGVLEPVISKVFAFDEVQEAHRWLGDRKNVGKVVVEVPLTYRYREPTMAVAGAATAREPDPIAIIGMSGRYAQSPDLEVLWSHLAQGDELTEEVTRWDLAPHIAGDGYCRRGGFLADIDKFDPLFFNISGQEATYMDPQQRLFLEESWTALEDAGYAGAGVEGRRCGVYVGCTGGDYASLFDETAPPQSMWGNINSVIPARIAYYLNLQGPAVAIDTACSSSLVAIHMACQSLRSGETDMALAGGVSIQVTPAFHVSAVSASMLSPHGRCHTFDDRADGFVPGEGVGVVVLKRLSEALADGDHVLGVIRGSGINQDGATNGITAPSALSQERLETEVYEKFGIDPAQIQMVEAHGTGTRLGDPIEYRALTQSFRKFTDRQQYCAIGSIKTNLGHTIGAAGVAGVLKILLALKHKQIPPSLHFEKGNTNIAFEGSPFFVNTALRAWEVEAGEARAAAVSSFGISGTNAHLVIAEAQAVEREPVRRPGWLVALSAQTAEQLRQQAHRLLAHCERHPELDCGDLSHTLLLGRRHFGHRLACVIRSREELVALLGKWLETGKLPQVYVAAPGEGSRREQASLKRYGEECIARCRDGGHAGFLDDLAAIADLHVQGYALALDKLFAKGRFQRLSLPTYPFARNRYWVPQAAPRSSLAQGAAGTVLHPLVQRNTSDLAGPRFSTTLTGEEFFLADHVVRGQKVLPGVTYLEMARAALQEVTDKETAMSIHLEQVVWARPIVVGERPEQVHIGLCPQDDGRIAYDIYGDAADGTGESVLYAQGSGVLRPSGEPVRLDIAELTGQCSQVLDQAQCYARLASVGVACGTRLQSVQAAYVGDSHVVGKLRRPAGTDGNYVLHPSMMDGALQVAIALIQGGGSAERTWMPFALQHLEVVQACDMAMWSVVRYSAESPSSSPVRELDVDICAEDGTVCVRMRGFNLREVAQAAAAVSEELAETMLLEPHWEAQAVAPAGAAAYAHTLVALCGMGDLRAVDVAALLPEARCVEFGGGEELAHSYAQVVQGLLGELQAIGQGRPAAPVLIQAVVPAGGQEQALAGVAGLLKSARQENARLVGQVIAVDPADDVAGLAARLRAEALGPAEQLVRYDSGTRSVARLRELAAPGRGAMPWKEGGVYLITGGAGGLSSIFVREIAQRARDVALVLTGRSALGAEKQAQLTALEALGVRAVYRQVDVADGGAVTALVASIVEQFGKLDGIMHAAGVTRDGLLPTKTAQDCEAVLAPKVAGLVNLDAASRALPLDFLICFSSGAGVLGNIGQTDYAAANGFMDAFAAYRNALVAGGQRHGHTLSVAWPLWAEGGMRIDAAGEQRLTQGTGMRPLQTLAGIDALYQAWTAGRGQVAVAFGVAAQIRRSVLAAPRAQPAAMAGTQAGAQAGTDLAGLRDRVRAMLTRTAAKLLGLPVERLDADAELSEYGFDSISLTEFGNAINKEFQIGLTPTVFFEYPTLDAFAGYLVAEHETVFAARFAAPGKASAQPARQEEEIVVAAGPAARRRARFAGQGLAVAAPAGAPEPVAIVGMSGSFPMAPDIEAFWHNLQAGRDCISEVPGDRWDWREHYGDPLTDENKTNVKWGGFLDGLAEFDPLFFGISPREAELMDPQQRLLMMHVWKAIEDAGHSPASLAGSDTALFVGTMRSGYEDIIADSGVAIDAYLTTGNASSVGPNRMSYLLNLHGPSEPVETACSSSLVALRRGVLAIESGESQMAIVGGVNAFVTPRAHISFSKAGMLSEDGRCKTFSDKANGYVRGEGVGMLVLKKLSAAERDGDHIYGVVRASAENHGGRASSLTAPNPRAQAALLVDAYRRAGIDPATVGYIEAHGTGTALGDPVEINGLKSAFKELYQAAGHSQVTGAHCGLGTVKSNIGHLELAAGVAGVIKVLLQLKHKTLVKSLHCETINPYIALEDSPFFIVQENQEWPAPRDAQGKALPRRAGVSSFGFGGVNAHVVIEEYVPEARMAPAHAVATTNPALVLLSAKNPERLRDQARQLLAWIRRSAPAAADLADLAYTLQVGREAMDERLALLVDSVDALAGKLEAFIAGDTHVEDLYQGQVRRNKDALGALSVDDDMAATIDAWVAKGKYGKLLDLWVKGLSFDWARLYGPARPNRLSLPSYPFAGDRYWVRHVGAAKAIGSVAADLHPLVHRNTSDLREQRFSTTLTGREFFLADHVVRGHKVMPGVAHLEMAREALQRAASMDAGHVIRLKHIVWMRPVVVGEAAEEVHIGLYPQDNGEIAYEIYSAANGGADEVTVYSQGVGVIEAAGALPRRDLGTLLSQPAEVLDGEQCYERLAEAGIVCGPRLRSSRTIQLGGDREAFARLVQPAGTAGAYVLHPSMMDGALQASIGLLGARESEGKTYLPFALDSVEIFGECTEAMWSVVSPSGDLASAQAIQQKFDIDVCDAEGNVRVRMKGMVFMQTNQVRAAREVAQAAAAVSEELAETMLLEPHWEAQAVAPAGAAAYAHTLVALCGMGELRAAELAVLLPEARCVEFGGGEELAHSYAQVVQGLLGELQAIGQGKPAGPVLIQAVVPAGGQEQALAGVAGLFKSARQENARLVGQVIAVDPANDVAGLAVRLRAEALGPAEQLVRYDSGTRSVARLRELAAPGRGVMPWKEGGVYLITGGAGGLGAIFVREIAQRARDVALVLTGRSALGAEKQAQLTALEALGVRAVYRQVDVADAGAVTALVASIVEQFGKLDGIMHAAGITRDGLLPTKTAQDCEAVLAPKVAGLVNLDAASRALPLDFLICFSSGAGVLGNIGQTDYAAANGFMDAFAAYRNALVAGGQRHGHTLSVAWPLWAEGGMRIDAAGEQRLAQGTGMRPLQTLAGIDALYQAWTAGRGQVAVAFGVAAQIRRSVLAAPRAQPAAMTGTRAGTQVGAPAGTDLAGLRDRVRAMLTRTAAKLLGLPVERLDADAELSEYGFDSISLTEFGNAINKEFQIGLTPTVFFEYPTLDTFAGYLVAEHETVFAARFAAPGKASAQPARQEEEIVVAAGPAARRRARFAGQGLAVAAPAGAPEPVAIVGMSGSFPMAPDIEAFWHNLQAGRDCISEVPGDRWDWREHYGDPLTDENKTNVKWGGFLDGLAEFDPLFFGISPREAELMDPQQRLLMMHVWKAIEDAGHSPASLAGSDTALFIGSTVSSYGELLSRAKVPIDAYYAIGGAPSVGPNRMSYLLNLHGPSEPVETACSSSLVALRRGVLAIESGESQMAIVGGVNGIVTPTVHISFSKAGMLSEDGRCKTFSDKANGYVRGEGVGMLVLKKLSAAERDGDHIYGVVRASAENHGGRASSLTAPNPRAQAALLVDAYRRAGIDPATVGYIEAHGTGTPLGDPVEINGLKSAFKELYQAAGHSQVTGAHCGLGTVKSNIGHLELAAGVAGVIKVLLQLKHKTLVKSLHCETINPYIALEDSPFFIVQENQEWPAPRDAQGKALPRRAGVSSFGFGGVNAHVVIEEYVPEVRTAPAHAVATTNPALVLLSAKNPERLRDQARQLLAWIRRSAPAAADLVDLAYTLQVGREAMDERLALLVDSVDALAGKLEAFIAGDTHVEDLYQGQVRRNKDAMSVFSADEELQEAIDKWVKRGKYDKLLDLWVKGVQVDWYGLYPGRKPNRISAPTYPFARDLYWPGEVVKPAAANDPSVPDTAGNNGMPSVDLVDQVDDLIDQLVDGRLSIDAAVERLGT